MRKKGLNKIIFGWLGTTTVLLLMSASLANNSIKEKDPIYKNAAAKTEERVEDLLRRMTLEEKVAQLMGFWDADDSKTLIGDSTFKEEFFKEILKNGIGQIGPVNLPIQKDIRFKNDIQKYLLEKTRLGIPALFHDEGCHGLMKPEATSFPMTIGFASSWDPKLFEQAFDVVAREMRSRGGQLALTPILDVARDARWGRIEETYGEDPFLNSRLGAAAVRGLQGGPTGEIDSNHVMVTLKHFTGHGTPEGGLNRSPGNVSMRELREVHLFPFEYVVKNTKPAAVMASYNEVDAIPSHANTWLLQEVLRKEYGFKGMIVSDYEGVRQLYADHKVAANPSEAALMAIKAGVQCELPTPDAFPWLVNLVQNGKLEVTVIDEYVRQLLTIKFKLGLFDKPYLSAKKAIIQVNKAESKALALKAAQESIVLLKNDKNILPLSVSKYKRIAVIGPNADFAYLGGYSGTPLYNVSVLDGIKKKVGNKAEVVYAKGCEITKTHKKNSYYNWKYAPNAVLVPQEENAMLIHEAIQLSLTSDVVVLVIGDNENTCREAWHSNHLGDRASLDLLGSQMDLVKLIVATGKPVVVYLMGGRPLTINFIKDQVPAILEGWYMGQETGTAAADILFGDVAPSGKLTVSFPQSVGHIPAHYSYKSMARAYNYMLSNNEPLFAFGHGLSYVNFDYKNLRLKDNIIKTTGATIVSVDITNTGTMKADEVVQLYIRDNISSVTRPVKELKGFERISLNAGETKTVEFTINKDALAFYDINMKYTVEPGTFNIMVGTASNKNQTVLLTVE
jgi:beta-glucosidase